MTRRTSTFRLKQHVVGAVILLTALAGWLLAYQTTRRLADGAERVARTQAVLASIRTASGALRQAETADRLYLLTAQHKHLQAYQTAIDTLRTEVGNLRGLAGDDAHRWSRVDSLARLLPAGTNEPMGRWSSAQVDEQLEALERDELGLLSGRVADARAHVKTVTLMLMSNGVLTLLILFSASLLFNRNFNRQQRDEERLRTALHDADAASQAKTRFLATVSHEMRTPLNAVSGMSQLLLETPLDSEQTEYARTVHGNAEALSLLIGDLLDSSKIEAGQVDLESVPFDVWELVEGVVEILVVRADIKGVELILDIAPDVPRSIVGDRNRLRQVVMNLVGNAVKFTEKGEVTVRLRSEPSDGGRAARLSLAVIDTGIGIAPDAQQRIFEPFVQAEQSIVRRYGGTGLGLNISRSLIGLMGGTLSLESEPGRGSTFEARITLPLGAAQPPPEFGSASLDGIEVLLAEANATAQAAIDVSLRSAGAAVRVVETPAEALGIIARGDAARAVVVSEHLRDSNGLDFAKAVWQARDAGGTPGVGVVLICSLRSMMTRFVGSYGITTCVYKPVKPARLIQAVRHAAGLAEEVATDATEELQLPARGGPVPLRILLAEDHPDSWGLVTRILVSAGYDVDLAENGARAVEMASAFRYDLILMDVEMPEMDGIEATRRIRAHEHAAVEPPAPIVALAAHAVDDVRQEARSAGMDDYTTKPLQKSQLLDVCSRWIDARPILLVADDSPEIHVLIENYLAGGDYRLVSAYNGRDAVAAFERQRISLVLLDMDMPVMNGYDVARTIRRARRGDVVPIVALTGYEGVEERQRCLHAGCTSHLSKQINRADLLTTIGGLLGRPVSRRTGRAASAPGTGPRAAMRDTDLLPAAGRLPSSRESSDQVRSLLARRDFDGIVALATGLEATAKALTLNKLATVSGELADAARHQDEERSAWWGKQLAPVLREAQRLVDVRRSAGTTVGGAYDALARLATMLLGVPTAAVTLLDEDRLRIKGGTGIPPPFDTSRELPLSHSIGQFVAAQGSAVLVEDARHDPRVREATAVTAHGLVSYGGVPLTTAEGTTLGAFCAMDERPRRWPAEDVAILEELAAVTSRMLELERLSIRATGGRVVMAP